MTLEHDDIGELEDGESERIDCLSSSVLPSFPAPDIAAHDRDSRIIRDILCSDSLRKPSTLVDRLTSYPLVTFIDYW